MAGEVQWKCNESVTGCKGVIPHKYIDFRFAGRLWNSIIINFVVIDFYDKEFKLI